MGEWSIEDNKPVFRSWKATGNQWKTKRKNTKIEEKIQTWEDNNGGLKIEITN